MNSIYEFTPADLQANQRGVVTNSQREWLKMIARGVRTYPTSTTIPVTVGFLFLGTCMILGLNLQNEDSRAALFSNPLNLLVFPAMFVVVLLILAFTVWLARRIADQLQNAPLQTAEGIIRLDEQYNARSAFTSYYVYVGKKRFGFTESMSHTFNEGGRYRVYYCKANVYELILSYERLNEPN